MMTSKPVNVAALKAAVVATYTGPRPERLFDGQGQRVSRRSFDRFVTRELKSIRARRKAEKAVAAKATFDERRKRAEAERRNFWQWLSGAIDASPGRTVTWNAAPRNPELHANPRVLATARAVARIQHIFWGRRAA
jgi:hypothetical protein